MFDVQWNKITGETDSEYSNYVELFNSLTTGRQYCDEEYLERKSLDLCCLIASFTEWCGFDENAKEGDIKKNSDTNIIKVSIKCKELSWQELKNLLFELE